ncbi:MAG: phenylpyruvate tautomerase MIF-related protein [Coriobacteriales bacterium]|nr:phenylpyruvate tautomerase MIF-related protein [Coriobacteriales bacterium]
MPFVDAKITVPVSTEKRDAIKSGLGKAISVFGKGESYLMVGIDDNYSLWLGGRKLEKGAFVSVSLIGDTPDEGCSRFTAHICDLLRRELDIPGESVYVTYHPMMRTRWGWNGDTF